MAQLKLCSDITPSILLQAKKNSIFDSFQQYNRQTTFGYQINMLDLRIARYIINLLNGNPNQIYTNSLKKKGQAHLKTAVQPPIQEGQSPEKYDVIGTNLTNKQNKPSFDQKSCHRRSKSIQAPNVSLKLPQIRQSMHWRLTTESEDNQHQNEEIIQDPQPKPMKPRSSSLRTFQDGYHKKMEGLKETKNPKVALQVYELAQTEDQKLKTIVKQVDYALEAHKSLLIRKKFLPNIKFQKPKISQVSQEAPMIKIQQPKKLQPSAEKKQKVDPALRQAKRLQKLITVSSESKKKVHFKSISMSKKQKRVIKKGVRMSDRSLKGWQTENHAQLQSQLIFG